MSPGTARAIRTQYGDEATLRAVIGDHYRGREVVCPRCATGIGRPCINRDGLVVTYRASGTHEERKRLARKTSL